MQLHEYSSHYASSLHPKWTTTTKQLHNWSYVTARQDQDSGRMTLGPDPRGQNSSPWCLFWQTRPVMRVWHRGHAGPVTAGLDFTASLAPLQCWHCDRRWRRRPFVRVKLPAHEEVWGPAPWLADGHALSEKNTDQTPSRRRTRTCQHLEHDNLSLKPILKYQLMFHRLLLFHSCVCRNYRSHITRFRADLVSQ